MISNNSTDETHERDGAPCIVPERFTAVEQSDASDIAVISRREFVRTSVAGLLALLMFAPSCRTIAQTFERKKAISLSIPEQRARITKRNKEKKPGTENPWSNKTIIENLTKGLSPAEAKRKIFEFVQSFPYRIRKFIPKKGVELYDEESGDCRHKSDALYHLLKEMGYEVRKLDVVFDWADLPIPREILDIKRKSGTRALHDALEVKINGKWIYVDPTWNPELGAKRFPVATWDGTNQTAEVTKGKTKKIPAGTYKTFEEMLKANGIQWPVRSETDLFNKKLNEWLNQ